MRLRTLFAALLSIPAITMCAQGKVSCTSMVYQNQNYMDYKRAFRSIRGRAADPNGVPVANVCVGIFSENDHRLVASAATDKQGEYHFDRIAPGHYRLVTNSYPFGAANARIQLVHWPRGGFFRPRKANILLLVRVPDATSQVTY